MTLAPGAREYPESARVWMAPCLLSAVSESKLPFGATTKNSEIFETGPIAELGIQPPLGVDVEVTATMWKMIVAFPVFWTETLSELGLRLAEVSWNLVMDQMPAEIPWW